METTGGGSTYLIPTKDGMWLIRVFSDGDLNV